MGSKGKKKNKKTLTHIFSKQWIPYPHGHSTAKKKLINFGQLYSYSCYISFNIASLDMCIACEFHQLWAVKPCIYHIFRHLTKWLVFLRNGHASTVLTCVNVEKATCDPSKIASNTRWVKFMYATKGKDKEGVETRSLTSKSTQMNFF